MAAGNPQTLLAALNSRDLPYVLIGGLAVVHHGHLRTTEDVDIVFHRTPASEQVLAALLRDLQAVWITNERDPATGLERALPADLPYIQTHHLMMLGTSLGYLDIYDFIPGFPTVPVTELWRDAQRAPDGALVVSRAWLVKLKRQAGRPKDLSDLAHLAPL